MNASSAPPWKGKKQRARLLNASLPSVRRRKSADLSALAALRTPAGLQGAPALCGPSLKPPPSRGQTLNGFRNAASGPFPSLMRPVPPHSFLPSADSRAGTKGKQAQRQIRS